MLTRPKQGQSKMDWLNIRIISLVRSFLQLETNELDKGSDFYKHFIVSHVGQFATFIRSRLDENIAVIIQRL